MKIWNKTEIKNMNSFRNVEKAIEFEIERQIGIIEKGEKLFKNVCGMDKQITVLCTKETTINYRYFTETDLIKVSISEEMINNIVSQYQNYHLYVKKDL